jgi:CRISPR-associated protein Cst1
LVEEFTDCLEADDWKNAAAIVGLIRFFEFAQIPYNRDEIYQAKEIYNDDTEYDEGLDFLKFNGADIVDEKLNKFIEDYFAEEMHHSIVEKMLCKTEWSKEEIDFVNSKLTANTVMKKIFSKRRFDGTNREDILGLIEENRTDIVRETYKNKSNLYRNFCNENVFRRPEGDTVRLKGYYVDFAKKGKSSSYRYDIGLFSSSDSRFYDFIPFAFTIGRNSFFINDNSTIKQLVRTNQVLQDKCRERRGNQAYDSVDTRKILFENIIYASDFLNYDVEIIKKNVSVSYFETFFLRRESITIFQQIRNYNVFCHKVKLGDAYVSIQEKVTDSIMNLQLMDNLIEDLLKDDTNKRTANNSVLTRGIINLNILIRDKLHIGGENMNKAMRSAYAGAENAVAVLKSRNQGNKINSYRTKLLSALLFHDYNRFSEILLSLSNYTDVYFPFAYDLFEDFEANKEAAYTFVNHFNEYSLEKTESDAVDNKVLDEK